MRKIIGSLVFIFCFCQISFGQGNIYFNKFSESNVQLQWRLNIGGKTLIKSCMNGFPIATNNGTTFFLSKNGLGDKVEIKRTYDGNYMIMLYLPGKNPMCLDGGGNGGETPYWHPNPDERNNWHKFVLISRDANSGGELKYVDEYFFIQNVQSRKCLDANTSRK